nr:MAG TPA: hypothetical protein [Caudoviricetes sp.]
MNPLNPLNPLNPDCINVPRGTIKIQKIPKESKGIPYAIYIKGDRGIMDTGGATDTGVV